MQSAKTFAEKVKIEIEKIEKLRGQEDFENSENQDGNIILNSEQSKNHCQGRKKVHRILYIVAEHDEIILDKEKHK